MHRVSASRAPVAAAARSDLTPPASRHRDDGAGEGEHLLAGAGDGQVDAEPAVLEHGAELAPHGGLGAVDLVRDDEGPAEPGVVLDQGGGIAGPGGDLAA